MLLTAFLHQNTVSDHSPKDSFMFFLH